MKAKELIETLQKYNPENEIFFNSAIASPDANIPIGAVYENRITFYTFTDGKTYSYIPSSYENNSVGVGMNDGVAIVLTDEVR